MLREIKMNQNGQGPLQEAIEEDSYQWMVENCPEFEAAIKEEINTLGRSPEDIRSIASRELGTERQAMVLRCYQVAKYLVRRKTVAK